MNEIENYPGNWQGVVPEEIKMAVRGEVKLSVNLDVCLEYFEHLVWPVYRTLEGLKVLDPACGTGEILIIMASKYPQVSFIAGDISAEALAQAKQYAEDLDLKNIVFLDDLPEKGNYDFIWVTRPLQQIEDLDEVLTKIQKNLTPQGLLRISAFTGSQPEENLYLQEDVEAMKLGQLSDEEVQELIRQLLNQPLRDGIDGIRECNRMVEKAGLAFLSGLHPRTYDPANYLSTLVVPYLYNFSVIEKAYLAEQFCGQMLMHSLLYTHKAYDLEMPSFYDKEASKYIPHLSPYVGIGWQEDRVTVGLRHQHLMLEEGIEFEDLSIPEELLPVLQIIDGKMNCEQIHRRFLPMSWERFWGLIQACWEEEIIFLHRP